MATLKHLGSKNADYGAAEQYLLFEHDEFTMKPVLDENGRLIPREDYRLSTLNCGGEDFAVACMRSNPPYSIKWEGDKNPTLINDPRFAPAGVLAPKGNADLAFVMHALAWLSNKGAAAIVCFPGVFYRGGAEQKIRRHLVEQNNVDAVIALPDNLFFGTSIATNVLVLKKNKKDNRVLFVDATREFVKVTKNNKLTEENIAKIADVVKNRRDIEYFSRVVPFDEIEKNKFNLTPSTYVEKPDTREKIDIVALNAEIKRIVAREEELRRQIDLIVADLEGV